MEKHQRTNTNKSGLFLLAMVVMVLVAAAGPAYAQAGDDILAELHVAPAAAKEAVLEALVNGTVYNDAAIKAFKALPPLSRARVVFFGLVWVRTYIVNPEFKTAYKQLREAQKPEAPAPRPAAGEQAKTMKADMEKSIAEMRQNMAAMDAEMKKQMEAVIKEMRAQMERMEKDPQQKELMRQMAEMTVEEDRKRHEEALAEWEQNYPADFQILIKKRINEFLAATAGVDFAAKLKPRGDKMIFVNEEYEQKPPEWKVCFRAGKEATEAARSFAQAWLAELNRN